ncbi:hypothetical protein [Acaryochloris sp. IP29b_bin.148]|uniref:hypothetical protein n=1 Tax=Acaryochloris sp. IP29b_bin.148 TaxID=2969218 RepID=UPI00260CFB99|nr:hypothetical protein [Acaryochloris sp. IP29b_bin.148]
MGSLPTGARGIEFTTDIERDPGSPPGHAYWSGPRTGVKLQGDFAIPKVLTIINRQQ